MRLLHLAYERPPHPDAVHHAATVDDARLVLHLLARFYPERLSLATALRNQLGQGRQGRQTFAVRDATALFRPIGWRLAQWLACVLPATDSTLERTRARIAQWLDESPDSIVLRPP